MKRVIIYVCVAASIVIPVVSGLLYGFDWGLYAYMGLAAVALTAIGIDQFIIRKRK